MPSLQLSGCMTMIEAAITNDTFVLLWQSAKKGTRLQ